MINGVILLLVLWVVPHLLIVLTIPDSKLRLPIFVALGSLLLAAYVMKPYTYDLRKYSIFFETGFIENQGWDSNKGFELNPIDTTGDPFSQGFEVGFKILGKVGNQLLPAGSLVPRIDPDVGDFMERGVPRSDAVVFLILILSFSVFFFVSKQVIRVTRSKISSIPISVIAVPVALGSVFFMLGSQNALRQFLGVSTILLALTMFSSRRYVTCVVLVVLSAAFHKWAPILGSLGVFFVAVGNMGNRNQFVPNVSPIRLSVPEVTCFVLGVAIVFFIKAVMVIGAFNMEVPLIGDLKPYIIGAGDEESLRRIGPFIKVVATILLFTCSELLLGRISRTDTAEIRLLRRRLFIFILPFSVYPEIFSRLIIFYWAIEAVFLVWALSSNRLRSRLAGSLVFIAYGFAPNAINVLIGPDWLYSL